MAGRTQKEKKQRAKALLKMAFVNPGREFIAASCCCIRLVSSIPVRPTHSLTRSFLCEPRSRREVSKRFGQMGSHLTTAKFPLSRLFPDALDRRDRLPIVIANELRIPKRFGIC